MSPEHGDVRQPAREGGLLGGLGETSAQAGHGDVEGLGGAEPVLVPHLCPFSESTGATGRNSPGQQSSRPGGPGTKGKQPHLKPASYPGVHLPDGYHLEFTGDPRQPRDSNYDDVYYLFDFTGCYLGSYDTKLVLLNTAERGSLGTCRSATRYTNRIEQKQLSRARRSASERQQDSSSCSRTKAHQRIRVQADS